MTFRILNSYNFYFHFIVAHNKKKRMILLVSIEKQSLHNITKSTNFGICATEYSSENICFVVFIVPYFGSAQNNKKKQKKQNSSKQLIPTYIQCQNFYSPNMVAGK